MAPSPPDLSATILSKKTQNQQKPPQLNATNPEKNQQWYAIGFAQQFETHF